MKNILILFIGLVLLESSCSSENDPLIVDDAIIDSDSIQVDSLNVNDVDSLNINDVDGTVNYLDITDAKALVIFEDVSTTGRVTNNLSNLILYKEVENGEYMKVRYLNTDGDTLDIGDVNVENIVEIYPGYVVLYGSFRMDDSGSGTMTKIIVSLSTGYIYDMSNSPIPYLTINDRYDTKLMFKNDDHSRAYFGNGELWEWYGAYKIDFSNEDYISIEEYLAGSQRFTDFEVDAEGNFYYYNIGPSEIRARNASGGIEVSDRKGFLFRDKNKQIYLSETIYHWESHHFNTLNIENGELLFNEVWSTHNTDSVRIFDQYDDYINDKNLYFVIEDETILIGNPCISFNSIDHSVEILDVSIDGSLLQSTVNFSYHNEGSKINRLNKKTLVSDFYELPSSEFDIYDYYVTQNDDIRFTGLRYSDGLEVNGIIDSNWNLTIVEDQGEGIITYYFPM